MSENRSARDGATLHRSSSRDGGVARVIHAQLAELQTRFPRFPVGVSIIAPERAGSPDLDRARALRIRSGFELALDPARALRTLAEARAVVGGMSTPVDCRDQVLRETVARCHGLATVTLEEIDTLLRSTPPCAPSGTKLVERRLLTPWLLAIGETQRARAILAAASASMQPDAPEWHLTLSQLVDQQMRVVSGERPTAAVPGPSTEAGLKPVDWYRLQVDFYWRLVDGDVPAARRTVEQIVAFRSQAPPAFRSNPDALRALCDAIEGASGYQPAPPDGPLALYSIGAVLIAAEAVAISGTREAAAEWSAWFDRAWPDHVLRAPAWPVLAHRVRGLLASRAGDIPRGLRWLEEAIVIADRIDSPVEAALARVQCAELLVFDPPHGARERWSDLVRAGTDRCRALGIAYAHHAHRARIAAALGRFDLMPGIDTLTAQADTDLTARELEVLRLFRDGNSYREAGAALGVGWRTVQSHAYNAYQKLGVSSKIAAVSAAARMGLI